MTTAAALQIDELDTYINELNADIDAVKNVNHYKYNNCLRIFSNPLRNASILLCFGIYQLSDLNEFLPMSSFFSSRSADKAASPTYGAKCIIFHTI